MFIRCADSVHFYKSDISNDAMAGINELFTKFDELCSLYDVRKIDTIGDAYWCAVGLEHPADHQDAARLTAMALNMQKIMREEGIKALPGVDVQMRIAVHAGNSLGGIVGCKSPRYHLFGRSVDVLMKLEPCGTTSGVIMSNAFLHLLASGYSSAGGGSVLGQQPLQYSADIKFEVERHKRLLKRSLPGSCHQMADSFIADPFCVAAYRTLEVEIAKTQEWNDPERRDALGSGFEEDNRGSGFAEMKHGIGLEEDKHDASSTQQMHLLGVPNHDAARQTLVPDVGDGMLVDELNITPSNPSYALNTAAFFAEYPPSIQVSHAFGKLDLRRYACPEDEKLNDLESIISKSSILNQSLSCTDWNDKSLSVMPLYIISDMTADV